MKILMIDRPSSRRPRRLPLPMSSGASVPRGSSARIVARPQTSKFYPERLLIKRATHWQVDSIRVDGRSDVLVGDLPGSMFALDVPGRFPGHGEIEVSPSEGLIVEVTYAGLRKAGLPFEACVFGSDDRVALVTSVTCLDEEKIATARSDRAIPACVSVKLATRPVERDAWPSRLVIDDASDWVVHDVCVGETSIFAQAGYVPGSMFSGDVVRDVESAICFGRLASGDAFSVVASYVGTAPDAELAYELYGTFDESEVGRVPTATILPMSSGISISSGKSAKMTSRCLPPDGQRRGIGLRQGFLGERIVVEDAADWVVNDVQVGRASQFAQSGDVTGLAFSPGILGGRVSIDVAPGGMDVAITATYDGPRGSGAPFVCGILGSLVDLT